MKLDSSVGELVAQDYRRALVFKKYGIDFCCGGKTPLSKACKDAKVDPKLVLKELELKKEKLVDFSSMTIPALVKHILEKHHSYLKENIPHIRTILEKVVRVHGDHHPELSDAKKIFDDLDNELGPHMMKEEQVLFPMMTAKDDDPSFSCNNGKGPIAQMEYEHTQVGEMLRKLRKTCDGYKPPQGACASYRALYALLEDMENDVFMHIHLENNVLFPKFEKTPCP